MAAKRVFVSFDWDNDRRYKHLLEAWSANPNFTFVFADQTPSEINTDNVGRVKAAITAKINGATHTLVIVGKYANTRHKDANLIGYKNWINFEVARSKANGNKLVGVKLDSTYDSPDELLNSGASWAMSFTEGAILKVLANA
jgi:hypothetical protein